MSSRRHYSSRCDSGRLFASESTVVHSTDCGDLPNCSQDDVGTLQNDTVDEVWVHPESLAMVDGAVISGAPLDAQEAPVVALWSPESKSTTETNEQNEASRYVPGALPSFC